MTTQDSPIQSSFRAYLASFDAVAGSLHLVEGDELHLVAWLNLPDWVREAVSVIPRGKGMAGEAWSRGAAAVTRNIRTDTAHNVLPGAMLAGAIAAAVLPVRDRDGEITAMVAVGFGEERDISDEEVAQLLERLAPVVSASSQGRP